MATLILQNRVLGGIRFLDIATELPISIPLAVRSVPSGPRVTVSPNRRSIHVLWWVEGFDEYVAAFEEAPAEPAVGAVSIEMEVRDPSGTYLPRQFTIALPRVPDSGAPDSVFEPLAVSLLRSPCAARSRNWAMVRIRVEHGSSLEPVPAALLRVVHDPSGAREVLGYGMSVVADPEARVIERRAGGVPRWVHFGGRHVGEASVPVVGLNSQIWAIDPDEDVVLSNIAASLEVLPMPIASSGRLPDPDAFFAAPVVVENSREITLSVGEEIREAPFSVTL